MTTTMSTVFYAAYRTGEVLYINDGFTVGSCTIPNRGIPYTGALPTDYLDMMCTTNVYGFLNVGWNNKFDDFYTLPGDYDTPCWVNSANGLLPQMYQ